VIMLRGWVLAVLLVVSSLPQSTGLNRIPIRTQPQNVYLIRSAPAQGSCRNVLFLPGDGGWRGFALAIAQTMSSWGYNIYAWDTKTYLESFTRNRPLTEPDVMGDFHEVAGWIQQQCSKPITLVGWSEGAGLCLLGAASEQNKRAFNGLVTLGLDDENILGWRWTDYLTYLTRSAPNEPKFKSGPYMDRVSPLPFWLLQSTGDQYVSVDVSRKLFDAAHEPKHYLLIDGSNHRFDGNHDGLFRSLKQALDSISAVGG
jgi:uncharacterized protein